MTAGDESVSLLLGRTAAAHYSLRTYAKSPRRRLTALCASVSTPAATPVHGGLPLPPARHAHRPVTWPRGALLLAPRGSRDR